MEEKNATLAERSSNLERELDEMRRKVQQSEEEIARYTDAKRSSQLHLEKSERENEDKRTHIQELRQELQNQTENAIKLKLELEGKEVRVLTTRSCSNTY